MLIMEKFEIHGYPTSSWEKVGAILANRPVKLDTSNAWRVVLATAATDVVIGFTQTDVDSLENGDVVGVAMRGVRRAVAGAVITIWAYLTATTDGKLIIAVGTDKVCAMALSAAAADLDELEIVVVESKSFASV